MLNICWTSRSSPKIKHVYIYGCPDSNMGTESGDVEYVGVIQCLVFCEQVQAIV